jgi:hypothetical protein
VVVEVVVEGLVEAQDNLLYFKLKP